MRKRAPKQHPIAPKEKRAASPEDASESGTEAKPTVRPDAGLGPNRETDTIETLRKERDACLFEAQRLAQALRALEDDSAAFRQRLAQEQERLIDLDRGQTLTILIDAIDELDRCLIGAQEDPLVEGVRMIRDGLQNRLADFGVEAMESLGTPFDPRTAEAVGIVATTDRRKDAVVADVLQSGYRFRGRVIRPARVRVFRSSNDLPS